MGVKHPYSARHHWLELEGGLKNSPQPQVKLEQKQWLPMPGDVGPVNGKPDVLTRQSAMVTPPQIRLMPGTETPEASRKYRGTTQLGPTEKEPFERAVVSGEGGGGGVGEGGGVRTQVRST